MLGDQVTQKPVVREDIYIHLYCRQYSVMSSKRPGVGLWFKAPTDAGKSSDPG